MAKSLEETAAGRRDYVDQVRASFYGPDAERGGLSCQYGERQETGALAGRGGFGFRLAAAVLLFAAFVYCDQKGVTFQAYGTADVVKQMEWNPLPVDKIVEMVMAQPDSP